MNGDNFSVNFRELTPKDKFGNIVDEKNIIKNTITFEEKLIEGDIVKLKDTDCTIIVKYINYEIPNIGIIEYAGTKVEIPSNRLVLFNQKDIECKVNENRYGR